MQSHLEINRTLLKRSRRPRPVDAPLGKAIELSDRCRSQAVARRRNVLMMTCIIGAHVRCDRHERPLLFRNRRKKRCATEGEAGQQRE